MKRDILNYLGEKIGELELPDNTPEKDWQERLSVYAQKPITLENKKDETNWDDYKGGGPLWFSPPND
jgi:hypothetical protein